MPLQNIYVQEMTPKTIHLCWFSNDAYPVEIKVCLDSWKRILPDYTVRLWDYDAAKSVGCAYIDEALSARKWAFAADALRFYAIYHEGGIYMDSDIFLYKRFDELIPETGVATFNERTRDSYTTFGLQAAFVMGEKGNSFCKDAFDYYASRHFVKPDGTYDQTISPYVMKSIAEKYGYVNNDELQKLDGITIYPTAYLSPSKSYSRHREAIGVHRIYGSWRKRKFGRKIEIQLKHIYHCVKYMITGR